MCVQWHSQVGRRLATIHLAVFCYSAVSLSPTESFAVQSAFCVCYIIMEYGSTPYIGMARKKNGRPISCVQNHVLISLVNP